MEEYERENQLGDHEVFDKQPDRCVECHGQKVEDHLRIRRADEEFAWVCTQCNHHHRADPDAASEALYEATVKRLTPRVEALIESLREALSEAGYDPSMPDWMYGNFYGTFFVSPKDGTEAVDVSFQFVDGRADADGDGDGEQGTVALSLDVTSEEGRMLGGMTPYNYSEDLWVDMTDDEAVDERMSLFEQASVESFVELFRKGKV